MVPNVSRRDYWLLSGHYRGSHGDDSWLHTHRKGGPSSWKGKPLKLSEDPQQIFQKHMAKIDKEISGKASFTPCVETFFFYSLGALVTPQNWYNMQIFFFSVQEYAKYADLREKQNKNTGHDINIVAWTGQSRKWWHRVWCLSNYGHMPDEGVLLGSERLLLL